MAELIIENLTSLYEPITIQLGKVVYTVKPMKKADIVKLTSYDSKIREAPHLAYERLEFALSLKAGTLDHIDSRLIGEITTFVIREVFRAKRKKVKGPGKKDLKQ